MEDVPIPSTTVSLFLAFIELRLAAVRQREGIACTGCESTKLYDNCQMLSHFHLFCLLLLMRRAIDICDAVRKSRFFQARPTILELEEGRNERNVAGHTPFHDTLHGAQKAKKVRGRLEV